MAKITAHTAKLLCLPLLAALFMLLQITGCYEYKHEYTKQDILSVGIVSDTTAILVIEVEDHYEEDRPMWFGGMPPSKTYREYSIVLADMRFEKIYWKKNIPSEYLSGFWLLTVDVIDSSLFFYGVRGVDSRDYRINAIAVVSMDEKFRQSGKIELRLKEIELKGEGWDYHSTPPPRVRPWRDGLLLACAVGDARPYALLDTAAGTMKLWQPSGEFEWLNDCKDYKWSQVGGLCLKSIPDTPGFVLLKNGVDTLAMRHTDTKISSPVFGGNSITYYGWMYLISQQGQVSEEILDVWGGAFFDLNGNLLADYNKK